MVALSATDDVILDVGGRIDAYQIDISYYEPIEGSVYEAIRHISFVSQDGDVRVNALSDAALGLLQAGGEVQVSAEGSLLLRGAQATGQIALRGVEGIVLLQNLDEEGCLLYTSPTGCGRRGQHLWTDDPHQLP